MKSIEELEKLSWEELENAAAEEAAPVPEGLEARIARRLSARAVQEYATPARQPVPTRIVWAVAAALTALLMIPLLNGREPKDTFDDPYLAYAEVEKTFQQISRKMAAGMEIAAEAKPVAEKPILILEKIKAQ